MGSTESCAARPRQVARAAASAPAIMAGGVEAPQHPLAQALSLRGAVMAHDIAVSQLGCCVDSSATQFSSSYGRFPPGRAIGQCGERLRGCISKNRWVFFWSRSELSFAVQICAPLH